MQMTMESLTAMLVNGAFIHWKKIDHCKEAKALVKRARDSVPAKFSFCGRGGLAFFSVLLPDFPGQFGFAHHLHLI